MEPIIGHWAIWAAYTGTLCYAQLADPGEKYKDRTDIAYFKGWFWGSKDSILKMFPTEEEAKAYIEAVNSKRERQRTWLAKQARIELLNRRISSLHEEIAKLNDLVQELQKQVESEREELEELET